jgi:hypothetical protein
METGDKEQLDMVLTPNTEKVGKIQRGRGNRGRTAEGLLILEQGEKVSASSHGTIAACQRLRLDLLGYRSVLLKRSRPGLTEPLPEVLVLC